jgi:hypothetical protein
VKIQDPRTPEQKTAITIEYLNRFIYWVQRMDTKELLDLETAMRKLHNTAKELDEASDMFILTALVFVSKSVLDSVEHEHIPTDDEIADAFGNEKHR